MNKKWVDVELYPQNNEFIALCRKFNIEVKKKTVEECLSVMRRRIKSYMKFRGIKEDSIRVYGLDCDYGNKYRK